MTKSSQTGSQLRALDKSQHSLSVVFVIVCWDTTEATSVQFSSAAQSCPTLRNPMDCSTTGLPGHHLLPELPQTHIHQVSDAIQLSHPLSSPSPPVFKLAQPQGLFQ